MPYIEQKDRNLTNILGPRTAGELNFAFTEIALNYLQTQGEKYQTYNDIIGALEGAKLELYRRKVGLYEDTKIAQNGDVYIR
jgi:hypothetical protein